jgi:hypothetical protein
MEGIMIYTPFLDKYIKDNDNSTVGNVDLTEVNANINELNKKLNEVSNNVSVIQLPEYLIVNKQNNLTSVVTINGIQTPVIIGDVLIDTITLLQENSVVLETDLNTKIQKQELRIKELEMRLGVES